VGYHNFLPVKRVGDKWETPWGPHSFKTSMKENEALLVVPDTAWKKGPSSFKVTIEEQYLRDTFWTFQGRLGERKVQIQSLQKLGNPGETLSLVAILDDCFLITL
jgi:hypothetical protein